SAKVPDEWRGTRVDLLWRTTAETTVWRDGRAVQGLHGIEPSQRPDAAVLDEARGGERVELALELACNGLFGQQEAPPELVTCKLARFDEDAWRLFHDFELLRALEASDSLERGWAGHLRSELNRFCNEEDPEILAALYEHRTGTRAHEISAIGHAHIDTAWLWPLAETYRKRGPTFGSQARYMDEYPEHRFTCPQAQQDARIKDRDHSM